MSQASKKDHISFIITFVIGIIFLLIFFSIINNSQQDKSNDNIKSSQCCECVKE